MGLLEAKGGKPGASGQAKIGAAVGSHVQHGDLTSDLDGVRGEGIQGRRSEPRPMHVRRHQQQRAQRGLEQEVVVDADHVEVEAVDGLRQRDVVRGPLVGLKRDAELHFEKTQTARRSRGSSASRTPSPMKLNAIASVRIASPGNVDTHHWSKFCVPAATIAPHSGAGGGDPSPRKLSPEKVRMAFPRSSVAITRAGARQFGNTTRVSTRASDAPSPREAWTYSFSLTLSTRLRITRA